MARRHRPDAHRFNPKVGMIRVWDTAADQTRFRVNIDATMNLELMFWAGQNGGNPQYADMAKRHAERALRGFPFLLAA